jgi:hypothetical protein
MKFFTWLHLKSVMSPLGRSQAQRDLRHGSAAGRLLELWVRILPGAWMFVSLWVMCAVRERSLRRADHSSRGVLPSVVYLSVIVKPWQRWCPGPLGGLLHHGKKSHLLITWYLLGPHVTIRYEYWSIIFPYKHNHVCNSFRLSEIVPNT